jgi:triphosphatase
MVVLCLHLKKEDIMESELKYRIKDREMADALWDDECLLAIADPSSREKLVMKAVYFDTEDHVLSDSNMAFRVRLEGESIFATLKWGGHSSNGFHEREEINVPVAGEQYFIKPPTDLFAESEDGKALVRMIGDKPLINMLETRYLRRRMRVDLNDCIMEIAIDTGSIVTDMGEESILELEIELFAGEVKTLKELGRKLAEKYGLVPENQSKLGRGLKLLMGSAAKTGAAEA